MPQRTYLERGLSVLEARLQNPQAGLTSHVTDARPFITVSRETGAGATTLGKLLIPLLDETFGEPGQGWVFLDKNLLVQALARRNLPERLAEHLPEDKISEIKAVIGELVGLHPPLWELERQVAEAILQLAHVGRVILVGRASFLITRSLPGGLHVRLVASMEVRTKRMMGLLDCSAAEAGEYIRKTDRGRQRHLRTRFEQDIEDPHTYDLVINTDRMSPPTVAHLVLGALRDRLADLQAGVEMDTQPIAASEVHT
jgi:cytidylate kinase